MTFSLRDLLALFVLLALALLAWRTSEEAGREQVRLAEIQAEIESLEARLRLDQPALHQAMLRTLDGFEPFAAMRQRSLAQFEVLREKYSTLEPRGADVLSLRGIPSLPKETDPAPVVFRLWVPKDRPVWIKFGVREARPSLSSSSSDNDQDWLSHSPFGASGPFETQLPPGDQMLQIAAGAAGEGSLPLRITLGETVLLRTSFDSPDVSGTGSSYITGAAQLDYGPRQQLPWLLTSTTNLREPATEKPHAFSLWLSDRTSGFAPFPGEASSHGSHRGTR